VNDSAGPEMAGRNFADCGAGSFVKALAVVARASTGDVEMAGRGTSLPTPARSRGALPPAS